MQLENLPYILNCRKSDNEKKKDWGIDSATAAGYLLNELPEPDESKDLHEPWWEIRNQGESGACVGFAVADSALRWHFTKSKSKTNNIRETDLLSVRYLWMASKETDEFIDRPTTFIESIGTSIKAALGVAQKYGVVLEKELGFDSGILSSREESKFYALAAKRRINGYFNLRDGIKKIEDLKVWRKWIFYHGPIVVHIDIDETWSNLLIADDKKAGKLDTYISGSTFGGHACALVGYTKDHFIVRNSWGIEWGHDGFAYATDSYALDAFTDAYGVVVDGDIIEV